jgi:hypothetical protein
MSCIVIINKLNIDLNFWDKLLFLMIVSTEATSAPCDRISISELVDNESNNPNVSLILIKSSNFESPKWVYMLKLVKKWLCKTRKYKTVVGGAILNYSFIFKF